jgi:hypothetical protein
LEQFFIAIIGSVSTIAILGCVGYFFRSWIVIRLKASIKHEYDLKILEIQHQKEIRHKSEIVSELLAQCIRKDGKLDYHELNKLSFQAFIWLPKDIAEELSSSLSHPLDSPDLRTLIKNIRTYLQGSDDGFKSKDIIVFNEPDIHSSLNTSNITSNAVIKPKPFK